MIVKSYRRIPTALNAVHLTTANVMREAAVWCGGKYRYVAQNGDYARMPNCWVEVPQADGSIDFAYEGWYITRDTFGNYGVKAPADFKDNYEEYI